MSSSRRRFTPEQKALIVRRHLANKESVSALAEEFGLQPSQIPLWVNQLLAHADKPLSVLLEIPGRTRLRPNAFSSSKPSSPPRTR